MADEYKPLLGEIEVENLTADKLRGGGVSLHVDGVSFYVKEKSNDGVIKSLRSKLPMGYKDLGEKEKKILHEAECFIPSGSLTAIMGPSGAGKSTLMDILANKRKKGRREGIVYANGSPQTNSFRRKIAYCTQEDILIPDLTVFETLYFAAHLLLPPTLSDREKLERVERVLASLRLTKIRDSLVGGGWKRGISGGEKRRVSIGLELLTLPCVLLGDELTSGLDSFSAFSLMCVLSSLASDGNTVVMNIHQPSSTLFSMFDNLILLADGRIIYAGPLSEVADHFASLGFVCPQGWAMADFLLELVSRCGEQSKGDIPNSIALANDQFTPYNSPELPAPTAVTDQNGTKKGEDLTQIFGENLAKHSPETFARAFIEKKKERRQRGIEREEAEGDFSDPASFANNWLVQVGVLMKRQGARWWRNPLALVVIAVMYLSSALIIGLLYSNVRQTNIEEQYTLSLSFSLDMYGVLAFLNIATYLNERSLFNRESSAGYYYTSAYFVSNFLMSGVFYLFLCVAMCAVIYYVIDYPGSTAANFGKYTLISYLNLLVFQSIIEWLSASFKNLDTAILVTGNLLVITMTLSGITVNYPNIPVYLRWLYWSNHMTYCVSALLVITFEHLTCPDENGNEIPCGHQYLETIDVKVTNYWVAVGMTIVFLVVFRFFTYLSLRFLHRET